MIIFKNLEWSNIFSYGENNSIQLDSERLVQITGENGNGKSAIAIILQELLYGKNSKNIKKEDLFNRYIKNPTIKIIGTFIQEDDEYKIELTRASTVKLKLYKNGNDISSHTATSTLKQLQEILGYDFKTFVQVTMQSSTSSLEFLTTTDTNRKNFLINLLNLDEYTDKHILFKNLLKESNTLVANLKGSISTIEDWITKHKEIDMSEKKILDDIDPPDQLVKKLSILEKEYAEAEKINKEISRNEQYKSLLNKIPTAELTKVLPEPEDTTKYVTEYGEWNQKLNAAFAVKKQYENLGKVCHTCGQDIDTESVAKICNEASDTILQANVNMTALNDKINEIKEYTATYNEHRELVAEFERLMNLIDKGLSNRYVDKEETKKQIDSINKEIKQVKSIREEIKRNNLEAESHNSKIKLIAEQLEEYSEILKNKEVEFIKIKEKSNRLDILKGAFSTKGLVAYKIETLIKELERQINIYLAELSNGKFLIEFILSGDKLNIDILTDAVTVSIESLSAGELSRVNIATLLAIRKLMSALSTNKINILFLDEITAVLDDEGKDKLIEMLFKEEDLNTFLIAHDYSHPLIPKIHIAKNNNISEIVNG